MTEQMTLSPQELRQFEEWGWVRVSDALPADLVARMTELVATESPSSIPRKTLDQVGHKITPHLIGAVNQLLGEGRWRSLKTLGGLLYTPPGGPLDSWGVPSDGWHWDNSPFGYEVIPNELMGFTFYAPVLPAGAGTLVVAGSHRFRAAGLTDVRWEKAIVLQKEISEWHPWLTGLMGLKPDPDRSLERWQQVADVHGVPVRVVELTGEPGEAVLCHPALLHAAAPNCRPTPRIMRRTNFRRTKD